MNQRCLPRLILALAAAGCSQTTADRNTTARVDTLPGGRVQVANTGVSAWTPATAWRLEEDLRLGTAGDEGPEAERFARIRSVVSDSRGMIYVLDATSQEIRVFHPTGAFSHTIGGQGRGPGELAGAFEMTMGPGDTLWVADQMAGRYSAFGPDGTFLRSHRQRIVSYNISGTMLTDGSYVAWGVALPEGIARVVLQPVRFAPGFVHPDSLPPLEFIQELLPDGQRPQPFLSGMVTGAVDRGGNIWFVHTREYRIFRRSLEGDTTLVFTLPAEAAPVGDTDRDNLRRVGFRMPPQLLTEYLDALPETRPIVHRILPDGAGHIFVIADVAGVPAGSIVDVFGKSGEYLGRMTLPTPVSLFPPPLVAHATPEHLYLVVRDELDVPYVSRLRIVRGGE